MQSSAQSRLARCVAHGSTTHATVYAIAVARSRIVPTNDATRDVFLDPDTGIGSRMPAVTRRAEYVYAAEIEQLADENPDRVLMVYQHRDRIRGFPADKLALLPDLNRFASVNEDVALIVVSRASRRLPVLRSRLDGSDSRWVLTPLLVGSD